MHIFNRTVYEVKMSLNCHKIIGKQRKECFSTTLTFDFSLDFHLVKICKKRFKNQIWRNGIFDQNHQWYTCIAKNWEKCVGIATLNHCFELGRFFSSFHAKYWKIFLLFSCSKRSWCPFLAKTSILLQWAWAKPDTKWSIHSIPTHIVALNKKNTIIL